MGKRYLIDSNIVIKFLGNLLNENGRLFIANILDEEFNISVITDIEVLGHHSITEIEEMFMSLATVYDLDNDIRVRTIELRKQHKIKLPDAIIAATALSHSFVLITQNERDFNNIVGLEVINPFNF